jgi:hypothetical protein
VQFRTVVVETFRHVETAVMKVGDARQQK